MARLKGVYTLVDGVEASDRLGEAHARSINGICAQS